MARVPTAPILLPDPELRVEGQHDDVLNVLGQAVRDTLARAMDVADASALAARVVVRADMRLRDAGYVVRRIDQEPTP